MSVLTEHFVLEYILYWNALPECKFGTGISFLTELLFWHILPEWFSCTGTSVLTEHFVLDCPSGMQVLYWNSLPFLYWNILRTEVFVLKLYESVQYPYFFVLVRSRWKGATEEREREREGRKEGRKGAKEEREEGRKLYNIMNLANIQ